MTTTQLIYDKFALFCKVYNLKTTAICKQDAPEQKLFYSNDFVKIDCDSNYGGYRIDVIHQDTSESSFNGSYHRYKAQEMIAYLNGLLAAKNSDLFTDITNN